MEPNTGEIRDGFVRQRRALIAVSLVLLFADIAELRITKLNLLGNEVVLGQPDAIYVALWIAFLYWLVRYYQHFRDLGDEDLMRAHNTRLNRLVSEAAVRQAVRDQPGLLTPPQDLKGETKLILKTDVLEAAPTHWKLQLTVRKLTTQGDASVEEDIDAGKAIVRGLVLFILKARAWLYVAIHTRLFTEYLLPFVIASLPIIYGLYNLSTGGLQAWWRA